MHDEQIKAKTDEVDALQASGTQNKESKINNRQGSKELSLGKNQVPALQLGRTNTTQQSIMTMSMNDNNPSL